MPDTTDGPAHGHRSEPGGDSAPPLLADRFEALIARNGSVALNGERLPVASGEEVHVAVLDAIHRAAQERGEPVEATVLDLREGGYATHIRVAPDGSSQLVEPQAEVAAGEPSATGPEPSGEPGSEAAQGGPEAAAPPAPGGPAPESTAPETRAVVSPLPGPEPDASEPVAGPAEPVAGPTGPMVPGELAEAVAHINRAAADGEAQRAMVLAFRLREHAVRSYGEEHPYALEARDLEAFVARQGGNYGKAAGAYLELTRICHQQGDHRAYGYLRRAVGNWYLLADPKKVLTLGQALLEAWSLLAAQGGPAADDTTLPRHMRLRMDALADTAGRPT
ncbi:hypothetical protein [Streptomyces qinglanensis]|uniref:Tetratricopeptide repeat-containing protein n=1 Tax=Streptomyces qinglanensis TaxID=943816 RepID=A0A1H9SD34_9ACTN|nr:hypothetical protein [Streptomyces qinglanensis]SER82495.1 hypothetical protein SAMN05421870_104426 [Streptomyces qinglanensis]